MRLLKPVAHLTFRGRAPLLGVFALLFVAAGLYSAGTSDALTVGGFDDPGSQSYRTDKRLERLFGAGQPDVLVAYSSPGQGYRDPAFRRHLEAALKRIEARPEVESVGTPYAENGGAIVAKDGGTVVVPIRLHGDGQAAYKALEPHLAEAPLRLMKGGAVPASMEAQHAAERDLRRAELITLPLLALLLVIFFRGVVAASLPLLIGGFAVFSALAIIRLITNFMEVSIFAMNIVTFVGLGVAVDYALFMVSRFRDELRAGFGVEEAIHHTMMTAGRTIGYSGLAVMASLLGMLAFPMMLLRSVAIGGTLVVLMALLASLIFLPAALAALGHRIDALRVGPVQRDGDGWHGPYARVVEKAMHHPLVFAIGVTGFLLVLGSPFLQMRGSLAGASILPPDAEARQLADMLEDGRFPPHATDPVEVLATFDEDVLTHDGISRVGQLVKSIEALPHVAGVTAVVDGSGGPQAQALAVLSAAKGATADAKREALAPLVSGRHTLLRIMTKADPETAQAANLVHSVRALSEHGMHLAVTGEAARLVDLRHTMEDRLPIALGAVCASTFVVLFLAFGSVVMPLKAIVMNILSLTASFGALVFIFQEGRFEDLLGFRSPGSIELTVPVVMFAVVFGLSMDYELFLLSRIRESYDQTGDTKASVQSGLMHTGKIITRAAFLLIAVMIGFVSADLLLVKELGVGMAIAIAVDATIVRLLLVPATMELLGKYNWWAPAPLARLWRRLDLGVDERKPEELAEQKASPRRRGGGPATV